VDSVGKFSENHPDIIECNRQHILPAGEKISAALEVYYKSVSTMMIRRRAARKQLHNRGK